MRKSSPKPHRTLPRDPEPNLQWRKTFPVYYNLIFGERKTKKKQNHFYNNNHKFLPGLRPDGRFGLELCTLRVRCHTEVKNRTKIYLAIGGGGSSSRLSFAHCSHVHMLLIREQLHKLTERRSSFHSSDDYHLCWGEICTRCTVGWNGTQIRKFWKPLVQYVKTNLPTYFQWRGWWSKATPEGHGFYPKPVPFFVLCICIYS